MRRRRAVPAIAMLLLAATPVAAGAKELQIFDPVLGALAPGRPHVVHMLLRSRYAPDGIETLAAPAPGSVVTVTLRSERSGEVLRFRSRPLAAQPGFDYPATVRITIPVRATSQRWDVAVHADGHTWVDPMHPSVDVILTTADAPPASSGHRGHLWRWVAGIGGPVVLLLGGALLTWRRRDGAGESGVAPAAPTG
jgi:hypothetical protein